MTEQAFVSFAKIPRLMRDCVITEKIDGTNASVLVEYDPDDSGYPDDPDRLIVTAGSRTRWIAPGKMTDNFGFAAWVAEHADELAQLGVGHHFGEWYGSGIQRGYGMTERRFALFNVSRWSDGGSDTRPACCDVVPVLYEGLFTTGVVDLCMSILANNGSLATGADDGWNAEGVVVYHTASRTMFKRTIEGDEKPKGSTE